MNFAKIGVSTLAFIASFQFTNVSANSCSIVPNGLVACYPFDGDAKDYSGNNNHGVLNGAMVLTTDRFGNLNSAYSFDGIDDFIQVKNSPSLNPNKITISAWYFGTRSFSGDGSNVIIHKPNTSHISPYYQWHLGITGDLYRDIGYFTVGLFNIAAGDVVAGGKRLATSEIVGKWNHILSSFDGNTMKVYINGKLEITRVLPSSSSISVYNTDVFIGKQGNWSRPVDYTPAVMDDILIYNRALSESEIQ